MTTVIDFILSALVLAGLWVTGLVWLVLATAMYGG